MLEERERELQSVDERIAALTGETVAREEAGRWGMDCSDGGLLVACLRLP